MATAKKKAPARKAASKSQSRELATTSGRDVEVPDYIRGGGNRGNEGVGSEDLIIPRIDLIQSLSPQRKKGDPAYIQGAEEGMIFNTVTRELYGDSIRVIPVTYKKEFVVWKDRQQGGGFRGSFETPEAADNRLAEMKAEGERGEIQDTANHLVLIVRDDDTVEEAILSMSRSKMKISRNWNSIIRMAGGDRFSRVYELSTVVEQGQKGDYYNLQIQMDGFPTEDQYRAAEELYDNIAQGVGYTAHREEESGGSSEY